ncbi:MAG: hypothetical protein ACW99A_07645 [Candidatus Kariarchaeaceae archaeon]
MKKTVIIVSMIVILSLSFFSTLNGNTTFSDQIHTRVSYLDLAANISDGGYEYEANVTVIQFSANVEVWNTANHSQEVGYHWHSSYCQYYLDVTFDFVDDVELYFGRRIYGSTCSVASQYYDPGLTTVSALVYLVFNSSQITYLPSGTYAITAPTKNGVSYPAFLHSSNGTLEYTISDDVPDNWGEAAESLSTTELDCTGENCQTNTENESESIRLPIPTITIFIALITVTLMSRKNKKIVN